MSNALYLFVREGVAKDIAPKPRVGPSLGGPVAVPSPEEQEAKIVMGEDGGDTVFPYFLYASIGVTEYTYRETRRETSTKRVENPSDSSQFVMVEQIDKLFVANPSNPKDKRTLILDNPK